MRRAEAHAATTAAQGSAGITNHGCHHGSAGEGRRQRPWRMERYTRSTAAARLEGSRLTRSTAEKGAAPGGGHGVPPRGRARWSWRGWPEGTGGGGDARRGAPAALGFGQRKIGSQTLNSWYHVERWDWYDWMDVLHWGLGRYIWEYRTWQARLPCIHMVVYDTYIYNYQIYSNRGD
jgi:hypothetical protein